MISNIKIGDMIGPEFQVIDIYGGEGKTGMGIVYVCFHVTSRVIIVLKTFQDKFIRSSEAKENFKNEAMIWINLDAHPNIVNAGTFEIINERPFIFLEFIAPNESNQKTLEDYFQSDLSEDMILDWAIQFCYGMEHAISNNVTPHRDIKPSNIMITRDQKLLKITDFGLAKILDTNNIDININSPKSVKILENPNNLSYGGTPLWMAPEQFDGISNEKSDIYSFGIVLFQLINNGKHPFDVETYEDCENAHKNINIPKIDSNLFSTIKKCVEKDPSNRYQSFEELRKDLERLFSGDILYSPESIDISADLIVGRAYGLENLGFKDDAISQYREAVKKDSKSFLTRINTGAGFNRLKKFDDAISEFEMAIKLESENPYAHYNLANSFYNSGHYERASKEYKKSINLDPNIKECHVNYGNLLRDMEKYEESVEQLEIALEIDQNFFKAKINLGITFLQKGDIKQALITFEEAENINNKSSDLYYYWGLALIQDDNTKEAFIKLFKSITLDPDNESAHLALATCFEDISNYNNAVQELKQIVEEINPKNYFAFYRLAHCYKKLGEMDEALKYFDKAIDMNPEFDSAWNDKGVLLRELDRKDDAIECYEKALEKNPNNRMANLNMCSIRYCDLKLKKKCLKCLNKILKKFEDFPEAWFHKGHVLFDLGRNDNALECLDKAIYLNKNIADVYLYKSLIFTQRKDFEKALETVNIGLEINPENSDLIDLKDLILRELGVEYEI